MMDRILGFTVGVTASHPDSNPQYSIHSNTNEMNTLFSYLFGPELIWFIAWTIIYMIGRQNAAPPYRFNRWLENLHWSMAPILVLTFLLLRVPFVEQTGLIIRIWIAGLLGAHIFLKTGLSAHSEQSPGLGAVYVNGTTKAITVLILFTIIVYFRF